MNLHKFSSTLFTMMSNTYDQTKKRRIGAILKIFDYKMLDRKKVRNEMDLWVLSDSVQVKKDLIVCKIIVFSPSLTKEMFLIPLST